MPSKPLSKFTRTSPIPNFRNIPSSSGVGHSFQTLEKSARQRSLNMFRKTGRTFGVVSVPNAEASTGLYNLADIVDPYFRISLTTI